MEYKIIKKNKLDKDSVEKTFYQIKKKSLFNFWYYPLTEKDDFYTRTMSLNMLGIIIGAIPAMIIFHNILIVYLLFSIGNILNIIPFFVSGYSFDNLSEPEEIIKKKIKKKNFIKKEEVVSLISYKNGDLMIEK